MKCNTKEGPSRGTLRIISVCDCPVTQHLHLCATKTIISISTSQIRHHAMLGHHARTLHGATTHRIRSLQSQHDAQEDNTTWSTCAIGADQVVNFYFCFRAVVAHTLHIHLCVLWVPSIQRCECYSDSVTATLMQSGAVGAKNRVSVIRNKNDNL